MNKLQKGKFPKKILSSTSGSKVDQHNNKSSLETQRCLATKFFTQNQPTKLNVKPS